MTVYVYVLWSESVKQFYVGITKSMAKRLRQHNSGQSGWTRNKGPWVEVMAEGYQDYKSARRRETFLKSGAGREWLQSVYAGYRNV